MHARDNGHISTHPVHREGINSPELSSLLRLPPFSWNFPTSLSVEDMEQDLRRELEPSASNAPATCRLECTICYSTFPERKYHRSDSSLAHPLLTNQSLGNTYKPTNDPTSATPVHELSSSRVILNGTQQSMLSLPGRANKCVEVTSTTAPILIVWLLRKAFQGAIIIFAI
ncbi:hypothetical protein K491DRAFT_696551 [Lophiostoma macrostomum CBS 122681]|uniref:Uncharacterized protein n=1 Tax=Lophiostoma macrostomum CBS 122681 TaxID=1314788 RepID=A0A6A6SYJ1_9PLEO|nr:hypothetical protein K491DRAFT_696551 [Lophiostoma macrostomum CBS 122681]